MEKLPNLTPRLKLIENMVRPGCKAADIGTDHAYLPIWLVKSGKTPYCIATDVNKGPLERAAENVDKYNAADKIELRLSNGLDKIADGEAQDIIIAGMGGELICEIIDCCGWIKQKGINLVLQPMTAQDKLRKYLCESGYKIKSEAAAKEKSGSGLCFDEKNKPKIKLYLTIQAEYSGEAFSPDEIFCLTGLLPKNDDALSHEYIKRQAEILYNAANGMKKSRSSQILTQKYEETARQLEKFINGEV